MTNSYGWSGEALPKGYIKPFNQTLVQAAAEVIGVYFSSGDNGDETATLGYASADWPASSPWVTAVGGTSLGVERGQRARARDGLGHERLRLGCGAGEWSAQTGSTVRAAA